MKFTKTKPMNGTCLKGYIVTTYDELVQAFGNPSFGPNDNLDDKVTCEWNLKFRDGTIATIYDWKEVYTPMSKHRWHIGGLNQAAVDRVYEALEVEHV